MFGSVVMQVISRSAVGNAEVNTSLASNIEQQSSGSLSNIEPLDLAKQAIRTYGNFTAENFSRVVDEDKNFLKAMQVGTEAYRSEGLPSAYVLVLGLSRKASNTPEDITSCEARALFYLRGLEHFIQANEKFSHTPLAAWVGLPTGNDQT
jgi:hypothetical protein